MLHTCSILRKTCALWSALFQFSCFAAHGSYGHTDNPEKEPVAAYAPWIKPRPFPPGCARGRRGRGPGAAQHPRPAASFGQKESPARFLWCVSATRFHLPMHPVESWCGCARCAQERSKQKTTRAQKGAPPQLQRHRKTWR